MHVDGWIRGREGEGFRVSPVRICLDGVRCILAQAGTASWTVEQWTGCGGKRVDGGRSADTQDDSQFGSPRDLGPRWAVAHDSGCWMGGLEAWRCTVFTPRFQWAREVIPARHKTPAGVWRVGRRRGKVVGLLDASSRRGFVGCDVSGRQGKVSKVARSGAGGVAGGEVQTRLIGSGAVVGGEINAALLPAPPAATKTPTAAAQL